jgi:phage tail-like protein
MMAKTPKTQRRDPYRNSKIVVMLDGRIVMGAQKSGALTRVTEVVHYREGTDPETDHKIPGRAKYEPITLEHGVTHDAEFENWANITQAEGASVSSDFRKTFVLAVKNARGQIVTRYTLYGCWVSEITMLPGLDTDANAITIGHIRLETEGWERVVGP